MSGRQARAAGTGVVGVLAFALLFAGCVGFKGEPKGKQVSPDRVKINFTACAGSSNGCSDEGSITEDSDIRLLAAIRVPDGTSSPQALPLPSVNFKLQRDSSYRKELREKAPTPDGYTWAAYSTKSFNYSSAEDPPSAKITAVLGLPRHPGGAFHYRPVLGFSPSESGTPIDCGEDPYAGDGEGSDVCIDAPDGRDETKPSLKIKLD